MRAQGGGTKQVPSPKKKATKTAKVGTKKLTNKKGNKNAPAQALGFFLQTTRMAQLLFEAPSGATVSLEVVEDVAVHHSEGCLVSQTKSATAAQNPISDRAIPFWKTFANWIDDLITGKLSASNTIFELYVSSPQTAKLAKLFSEAKTREEALQTIQAAKKELLKDGLKPYESLGDELAKHVKTVLEADKELLSSLIQKFQLTIEDGSPRVKLKAVAQRYLKAFSPNQVDFIQANVAGWIKEQIDSRLELKLPAIIAVDTFWNYVQSFLQKYLANRMLVGLAGSIEATDEDFKAEQFKMYIRQLDIVGCDQRAKLEAVRDFMRASSDRTFWADNGIVNDFKLFEDDLTAIWSGTRRQFEIIHKTLSAEDRGQLLVFECLQRRTFLEGIPVDLYFSAGSFHALAEDLKLGWHPDFATLLKGNE